MRFFKIFHFLSLDVVLGAVSMHLMVFHVVLGRWSPWEFSALLAAAVFLVYGMDRQIDNLTHAPMDELHAFHAKFRTPLFLGMGLVLFFSGLLLLKMERLLIGLGLCLLLTILFYWIAWVKNIFDSIWGLKELGTALIYSLGILIPTIASDGFSIPLGIIELTLFWVALLNLWLFTSIEMAGMRKKVLGLLCLLPCWLFCASLLGLPISILVIMGFIWGIHAGIYYFRPWISMRLWAEWAFMSPLIYILCNL
ncbi:MAG: hypothetical protein ACKOXH_00885 [Aquirufa sp.]